MIRSTSLVVPPALVALVCASGVLGASAALGDERPRWNDVPLDRVYPYPSKEERSRRIARVRVVAKSAEGVPEEEAGAGRREIQKQIAGQVRDSGAQTVSKGAAYAVVAELTEYEYAAEFDAPTNWLFKGEEEMAAKPGKCRHSVDLELSIDVHQGRRKQPIHSWSLEAWADGDTKTTDQSCPFSSAQRQELVVSALREAMPCLQVELMNLLAPRGHIVAQQRYGERGDTIFQTTLDRSTLPEAALSFAIKRVQASTNAEGDRERTEHQIARGRPADRPGEELWIELKLSKALLPPLAGDVVRPIIDRGMVSRMNPFGGCDEILEPR